MTVGGSGIDVYPREKILQSADVVNSVATKLACIDVWPRRDLAGGSRLVFVVPGDLVARVPYVQKRIAAILEDIDQEVHVVVDVGARCGIRKLADLFPGRSGVLMEAYAAAVPASCVVLQFKIV